jgi:MscS family membrane protein
MVKYSTMLTVVCGSGVSHMCRNRVIRLLLLVYVACTILPSTVSAQQVVDLNPYVNETPALESLDQRTPLAAAEGFMRAAELGDYEVASKYLDLRYLPEGLSDADGSRLAEQLYIVISRKLQIDFGALSPDPEGLGDDGLPSYRDLLGKIVTIRGSRPIYLQRIPGENGSKIWRISNATIAELPDLYGQFGYSPFVEKVRSLSPSGSFLGVELFNWIVAVLAGSVAAIAWLAIAWPLSKIVTRRRPSHTERVRRYLTRPIPAVIFVALGTYVLRDLGLGATANRIAEGGTVVTLVVVWLLFATINLIRDLYSRYLQARGRDSGLMLVRPVTSTCKVLISLLAITIWLDNVGVNVTALVAGLGVGGLAVALVLQKPMEDILGAITLYTQQPVTVGQFCTSGDVSGTIEEINLRSTRVRKINNNIVVIPNSLFATASIENISERKQILHQQLIRLALDTSEAQLRDTLAKLRDILRSHPHVLTNEWRVRFLEFGEFSKNIEIFAHINTTDWQEFLEIAENLNLKTGGVLESTGVRLALPTR